MQCSFKGTQYHGWQIQPGAITVQEVLTNRISRIFACPVSLTGCGRTDAGVHARVFWAHFDSERQIGGREADNIIYRMNRFLPADIAIHKILPVHPAAHARFSATERTYQYYILRVKDAFMEEFAWYYHPDLNLGLMQDGALLLKEYIDFACFSKSGSDIKGTECSIIHAGWEQKGDLFIFTISANRFLRNMVRAVVGTLLELGRKKYGLERLHQILRSKNRCEAGESVPACGLFLTGVRYPDEIFMDF